MSNSQHFAFGCASGLAELWRRDCTTTLVLTTEQLEMFFRLVLGCEVFGEQIGRVVAAKGLKDAMVSLRVDVSHRHRSRVGCGSQVCALLDGIRAYHEQGMVAL